MCSSSFSPLRTAARLSTIAYGADDAAAATQAVGDRASKRAQSAQKMVSLAGPMGPSKGMCAQSAYVECSEIEAAGGRCGRERKSWCKREAAWHAVGGAGAGGAGLVFPHGSGARALAKKQLRDACSRTPFPHCTLRCVRGHNNGEIPPPHRRSPTRTARPQSARLSLLPGRRKGRRARAAWIPPRATHAHTLRIPERTTRQRSALCPRARTPASLWTSARLAASPTSPTRRGSARLEKLPHPAARKQPGMSGTVRVARGTLLWCAPPAPRRQQTRTHAHCP